ncbi:MAG: glycosyltransferase [Acidobacteria bacterium]|nr:glycosyltransferase [Acidobacteriota bacterium]
MIPVFNCERYIAETIDSVLAQRNVSIQLIVVNDGSTDGTNSVVRQAFDRYQGRDVTLVSGENRGICAALNEGLRIADGEFFAYLGADDIWHPEKCALQVQELKNSGREAVYSDCFVIDAVGTPLYLYSSVFPFRGGNIYEDLLWARFRPPSPTHLLTAAIVRAIGGFDETQLAEDLDMWLRIAKDHEVGYIPKPLASYRTHVANMSKDLETLHKYTIQALDSAVRRDPAIAPLRSKLRAELDSGRAASHLEALEMDAARHYALRALKRRPTSVKALRTLALSCLGKTVVRRARSITRRVRG